MAGAWGFALWPGSVEAAELVKFERRGCPWCKVWDKEIGSIYPKTEVGKRAPLRRVDLDAGIPPGLTLKRPILYTPTFVLIEDGSEVDRIEGYPVRSSSGGGPSGCWNGYPLPRDGLRTARKRVR